MLGLVDPRFLNILEWLVLYFFASPLVRLINDILDIERIESGKAKMEPEICNILDLITQAVNVMQPLADKAEIKLSISALSVQVLADCDRIVQTLTNLLSNASELPRRKTDGASQFIGNSFQNSVVKDKSYIPSKGRSPGSQDPNFSLATYTY
ncbi:hypothetical protein ANSO36C_62420 [Nostoc cf. commune SO-36]|uniref:histidine kinase n=1 Tax=Nostoc cf. commune SO-36 TaxID=449208 RepID=A0ABN6QDR4_NOSCO|nr:hypothetical protein ANSO36C_62420 [Nostoc cf. commune SO-36]